MFRHRYSGQHYRSVIINSIIVTIRANLVCIRADSFTALSTFYILSLNKLFRSLVYYRASEGSFTMKKNI